MKTVKSNELTEDDVKIVAKLNSLTDAHGQFRGTYAENYILVDIL